MQDVRNLMYSTVLFLVASPLLGRLDEGFPLWLRMVTWLLFYAVADSCCGQKGSMSMLPYSVSLNCL